MLNIKCGKCGESTTVGHMDWSAIECPECKREIRLDSENQDWEHERSIYVVDGRIYNIGEWDCDYDAAVSLMDDELRERLHGDTDSPAEFISLYIDAHREAFSEEWAPV